MHEAYNFIALFQWRFAGKTWMLLPNGCVSYKAHLPCVNSNLFINVTFYSCFCDLCTCIASLSFHIIQVNLQIVWESWETCWPLKQHDFSSPTDWGGELCCMNRLGLEIFEHVSSLFNQHHNKDENPQTTSNRIQVNPIVWQCVVSIVFML